MAIGNTITCGMPPQQGGQGAVEALLALPVFLALICILFQLFFIGIAQIQLQYATFYAARVGVVHGANKKQMKRAAQLILAGMSGTLITPDRDIKVEILDVENPAPSGSPPDQDTSETLKVLVHWHYPLIVPLADVFLRTKDSSRTLNRSEIHLSASWAMNMSGITTKEDTHAGNP